jgi:hypothetical protein
MQQDALSPTRHERAYGLRTGSFLSVEIRLTKKADHTLAVEVVR